MSASHHQGNLRYNSNNGNKFRAADTNDINSNSTAPPTAGNRRGRNLVDLIQEVKKNYFSSSFSFVYMYIFSCGQKKREKSSCIVCFFADPLYLVSFLFCFCVL